MVCAQIDFIPLDGIDTITKYVNSLITDRLRFGGTVKTNIIRPAKKMSESNEALKDFDWKLKLALESNKVSALNTPIVELTLHTNNDSCSVEMDSLGLDNLIDKIKEALSTATNQVSN